MRLIDLDALPYGRVEWEDIIDAPTVDAVPVTRCANCVWYVARELKYDGTPDKRYKPSWCELWRAEMKGNDYCSRGESNGIPIRKAHN